jgi:hypothetical protein
MAAATEAFSRRLSDAVRGLSGAWYGRHMAAADRAIRSRLPLVDLVLEVRDARVWRPLLSTSSLLSSAAPDRVKHRFPPMRLLAESNPAGTRRLGVRATPPPLPGARPPPPRRAQQGRPRGPLSNREVDGVHEANELLLRRS